MWVFIFNTQSICGYCWKMAFICLHYRCLTPFRTWQTAEEVIFKKFLTCYMQLSVSGVGFGKLSVGSNIFNLIHFGSKSDSAVVFGVWVHSCPCPWPLRRVESHRASWITAWLTLAAHINHSRVCVSVGVSAAASLCCGNRWIHGVKWASLLLTVVKFGFTWNRLSLYCTCWYIMPTFL